MTTSYTDVPTLCDAATTLALGLHFDLALHLLDAAIPEDPAK